MLWQRRSIARRRLVGGPSDAVSELRSYLISTDSLTNGSKRFRLRARKHHACDRGVVVHATTSDSNKYLN